MKLHFMPYILHYTRIHPVFFYIYVCLCYSFLIIILGYPEMDSDIDNDIENKLNLILLKKKISSKLFVSLQEIRGCSHIMSNKNGGV